MTPTFSSFFEEATKHQPFDYQRRLACGDKPDDPGTECKSLLIDIPTGLGKTAAVVMSWMWNRVVLKRKDWPRRLVYCLPMRTLVEQTTDSIRKWLKGWGDLEWDGQSSHKEKIGVHILMGGEQPEENPWDLYPEENAILIGTQDMLLSRALNRGYGMSRYRWPMHFGLLNNDSLWVMDETQLMGVGVETSAQLDGFRHDKRMPIFGLCPTWWMSATLDEARLETVDHPKPTDGWPMLTLTEAEKTSGRPRELITAPKKLSSASLALASATKDSYAKQLAVLLKERHQPGSLTLVVLNRVSRAREVYEALTTLEKKRGQPLYDATRVALIHSRFRPNDRKKHQELLFGNGDRIVIATQAIEAGIDVSARLLITELAPWSSLVQRMGRCNRYANISDAEVMWIDIEPDTKGELVLPYTTEDLAKARAALSNPKPLTDASPLALSERGRTVTEGKIIRPVVRRRDLVDLFDTTPDLCGQDLDISRYIRDGEDNDVQFFWRTVAGEKPPDDTSGPVRHELCRVSIGDAAKFFKSDKVRAWRWNPLEEEWEGAAWARPGAVYLVDVESGGYDDALGWTGDPKDRPTPHPPTKGAPESYGGNRLSFDREWQTLAKHTAIVVGETEQLTKSLALREALADLLHKAALWHDIGKAHRCFQAMLRLGPHRPDDARAIYAKSRNPHSLRHDDETRRGFRHELASALAWLLAGPQDTPERDLIAYLIAAHHGKVRLSIRSLPNEEVPGDERLFARGVWQDDKLPPVEFDKLSTPEITLDLSFMKMGEGPHGPSWLARVVALRDRLGPFQLAFLETLLRAADARASRDHTASKPNLVSGVSSAMELREEPGSTASPSLSPEEQALVSELVEDGLSIQDRFRPEPLYKLTGQGHYESRTVEEIRKAKKGRGSRK